MSIFYKWKTASDAGPDIIRSHLLFIGGIDPSIFHATLDGQGQDGGIQNYSCINSTCAL